MTDENDLGDFKDDRDMAEQDAGQPEPIRDADEFAQGRSDAQSVGVKIRAKLKRGTGTRDQDEILIEGRGVNAQDAANDFEQALTRVEEEGWTSRLRELQDEER